jgi:hypothetical protein
MPVDWCSVPLVPNQFCAPRDNKWSRLGVFPQVDRKVQRKKNRDLRSSLEGKNQASISLFISEFSTHPSIKSPCRGRKLGKQSSLLGLGSELWTLPAATSLSSQLFVFGSLSLLSDIRVAGVTPEHRRPPTAMFFTAQKHEPPITETSQWVWV